MRELLLSGAVGKVELDAQQRIRQDINERWSRIGLTAGLEGQLLETISTLYENQAKHLLTEAAGTDSSGSFETVVFPLIRRVFSRLLANDIVSVQAMNLPIGKLFFILPVTSERNWTYQTEGEINDGDTGSHVGLMGYKRTNRHYDGSETYDEANPRSREQYNRYALPDEVVQPVQKDTISTDPEVTRYMKKSLYDLFYDDFLYDNSKGKVTIRVGSATVVTIGMDGRYHDADLDTYPVNGMDGSISNLLLDVTGFSNYNAGRLTGPDGNEMDSEGFLASLKVVVKADLDGGDEFSTFKAGESVHFNLVTQKYGDQIVNYNNKICDAKGHLYIELDLTKPAVKQGKTINGYIGIDPEAVKGKAADDLFKIAWAQYDSLEFESEIGEVSFELKAITVTVEERKLRANWSPELSQDVSAFHSIDAEAELTAILSEQIGAEVDREILRDLRKGAAWTARWDYNGWQRIGTPSTIYTQKDWNQTLITKVNQLSAQIQKSTLRGGADFIVCSAEISAVFNDLEYFHVSDASAESMKYNMGIEEIGRLAGRYQVVVDPYAPWWSLIMGHHGSSLLDTGYIYAPYVPMALTPVLVNPHNFTSVRGIMTRYAKKMVNNKYYASLRCDGLQHWSTALLR